MLTDNDVKRASVIVTTRARITTQGQSRMHVTLHSSAVISRLFQVTMLEKCVLTIAEFYWCERCGNENKKNKNLSSSARVVYITAKQITSRSE